MSTGTDSTEDIHLSLSDIPDHIQSIIPLKLQKQIDASPYYVFTEEDKQKGTYTCKLYVNVQDIIAIKIGKVWGIDVEMPLVIEMKYDIRCKVKVYQEIEGSKLYQLTVICQKIIDYIELMDHESMIDQVYMEKYGDEINAYIAIGMSINNAIILHKLFQEKVEYAMEFYEKRNNIFVVLHDYIRYRLPTICNHCVLCDEIPDYVKKRGNVMLKPFICRSALCNFQYLTMNLGVGTGAIASSLNLSYLLTFATITAIKSRRMVDILNPYPTIMNPDGTFLLSEDNKNNDLLKEIANAFPIERTDDFIHRIMECHPLAYALYKNIEDSNRSYISEIIGDKIPNVGTDEQYAVVMDSPERDADFKQRKSVHGSVFAFHGSPPENWHAILRTGLKNATGTKLMISGNAYGPGIYVSPLISYSCNYSLRGADYNILSIVELIDRDIKRHDGSVWTLLDEGDVAIRFLLVYKKDARYSSGMNLDTKTEGVNEMLREVLSKV